METADLLRERMDRLRDFESRISTLENRLREQKLTQLLQRVERIERIIRQEKAGHEPPRISS